MESSSPFQEQVARKLKLSDDDIYELATITHKVSNGQQFAKKRVKSQQRRASLFSQNQNRWFYLDWESKEPDEWRIVYSKEKLTVPASNSSNGAYKSLLLKDLANLSTASGTLTLEFEDHTMLLTPVVDTASGANTDSVDIQGNPSSSEVLMDEIVESWENALYSVLYMQLSVPKDTLNEILAKFRQDQRKSQNLSKFDSQVAALRNKSPSKGSNSPLSPSKNRDDSSIDSSSESKGIGNNSNNNTSVRSIFGALGSSRRRLSMPGTSMEDDQKATNNSNQPNDATNKATTNTNSIKGGVRFNSRMSLNSGDAIRDLPRPRRNSLLRAKEQITVELNRRKMEWTKGGNSSSSNSGPNQVNSMPLANSNALVDMSSESIDLNVSESSNTTTLPTMTEPPRGDAKSSKSNRKTIRNSILGIFGIGIHSNANESVEQKDNENNREELGNDANGNASELKHDENGNETTNVKQKYENTVIEHNSANQSSYENHSNHNHNHNHSKSADESIDSLLGNDIDDLDNNLLSNNLTSNIHTINNHNNNNQTLANNNTNNAQFTVNNNNNGQPVKVRRLTFSENDLINNGITTVKPFSQTIQEDNSEEHSNHQNRNSLRSHSLPNSPELSGTQTTSPEKRSGSISMLSRLFGSDESQDTLISPQVENRRSNNGNNVTSHEFSNLGVEQSKSNDEKNCELEKQETKVNALICRVCDMFVLCYISNNIVTDPNLPSLSAHQSSSSLVIYQMETKIVSSIPLQCILSAEVNAEDNSHFRLFLDMSLSHNSDRDDEKSVATMFSEFDDDHQASGVVSRGWLLVQCLQPKDPTDFLRALSESVQNENNH